MRGVPLEMAGVAAAGEKPALPKICFISSHAQLGGSEVVLQTILEGLPRQAVESVVLLQDGPFGGPVEEFRPQVIPTSPGPVGLLKTARRLRTHLRHSDAQLVHANGVKAALVAVLARPKVPILWMKHDFSFDGPLGRWVAHRSKRVVGVSVAVLEAVGRAAETKVVHPATTFRPADRESSRAALTQELGLPHDVRLIGLLGRLHPSKGHQEIIAALPGLATKHPSVHLVFAGGDDPSAPKLRSELTAELARQGTGTKVSFLGHREDVPRIMAALDVLVVPSVVSGRFGREGFGLTAVEAMASETPVVAYDSGALREVLGDCGFLITEGNRAGLEGALRQVLDDPLTRERLASCGPKRVAARFTAERMVREMEDQYRECVRGT